MNRYVDLREFGANPAMNYQRYFVPAIGGKLAEDLVAAAALQAGERVLDVACGTGVVARRAADAVGPDGTVCGLDVNPAMLQVAETETSATSPIEWRQANAEAMPFADKSFDVVFCQMGLQFIDGKLQALREMRRVLDDGGRALVTVPGPQPRLFAVMRKALATHVGPEPASFADLVFSLHDVNEMRELMLSAGFSSADVRSQGKSLDVPPPREFMWQYLMSTPVAAALAEIDAGRRDALERDVVEGWKDFAVDGGTRLEVAITTGVGRA